jgi:PRC-barrel domain
MLRCCHFWAFIEESVDDATLQCGKRFAFGLAAAAVMATASFAQTTTPSPTAQYSSVSSDAVLSYNLIGLNVQDGANNTVGQIKDLVLEKGQLAGYILSVGGFLGMGEHYVVVQPASIGLTWDQSDKKWKATINATKDELKAAPEFKYEGKFKAS